MCAALAALGVLSASSSAKVTATAAKAAACGVVPNEPAADPNHILAQLPKSYAAQYNGYGTVHASKWANWKPKGPFTVDILWPPPTSTFAETTLSSLESGLESNPKIGSSGVTVYRTDTPVDVSEQIQQMQTAISAHASLIVLSPLAPTALAAEVTAAGQAGIPVISILNTTPSPYAINVLFNPYLNAALPTAAVLRAMHEKGTVLEEIGIPGIALTTDNEAVWAQLLKPCKNITVADAGSPLVTDFTEAVADQVTTQFLATYSSPINGVLEGGVVAPGIMQAFVSAGRAVPSVADEGAQQGSLAYWLQNKRTYTGAASGYPPNQYGTGLAQVALRMLLGQGVKSADIVQATIEITSKNLSSWISGSATLSTQGDAVGPAGVALSTTYLKPFFKHFGPIS
jgi:ABC-type sugar transport system substrate-binding protein